LQELIEFTDSENSREKLHQHHLSDTNLIVLMSPRTDTGPLAVKVCAKWNSALA